MFAFQTNKHALWPYKSAIIMNKYSLNYNQTYVIKLKLQEIPEKLLFTLRNALADVKKPMPLAFH